MRHSPQRNLTLSPKGTTLSPITQNQRGLFPNQPSTTGGGGNSPLTSSLNSTEEGNGLSPSTPTSPSSGVSIFFSSLKTIIVVILKFLFICANVAFAIGASKVVFCSTFFLEKPTHWTSSSSMLTSEQKDLVMFNTFGERFQYCVKNF